jgi:hypothetical protein
MASQLDTVLAETLAMVNVVRTAYGADALTELPSATPGNASDCIFARALRDVGVMSVGGGGEMRFADSRIAANVASYWGVTASGDSVAAPHQFGRVIDAFDGRQLPEFAARD